MTKPIHRVEVGDLVRRTSPMDRTIYPRSYQYPEVYMVMDVQGPDDCRGRAIKAHEMTLKLWEVAEPQGHFSHVPMNLYEVV